MNNHPNNHHAKKEHDIEASTIEMISKSEHFIERNKKLLIGVMFAIILIVAAILAYVYLYRAPHIRKGAEAIYTAEYYFDKDSFQLALNGNGADVDGFLKVIDKYGSTPSGNLAEAYAGICLYKLGDYKKAEKHLEAFDSKDDFVSPTLVGLIGDCYVQQDKYEKGVEYFEKAAKRADNNVISPIYLKKAATVYIKLGKKDKALECYKMIKDKYYNSVQAGDIDKYITELEL